LSCFTNSSNIHFLKEVSVAAIAVKSLFEMHVTQNPIFFKGLCFDYVIKNFESLTWCGAVQVAKTTDKYSVSKVHDPNWVIKVCGASVSCHSPRRSVTLFQYPQNSLPCTVDLLRT
jgi:hypothetical protein